MCGCSFLWEASMTKAVIFDLFETLVTEWGHEKYTKRKMCADLGLPYEAFSAHWEALHEKQYRGEISFADSIRYAGGMCGIPVPAEKIRYALARRVETKAACFGEESMHPGILPMLAALRERGYRLCLLSNCSGEEVESIRESILAPYFDGIVLSHETGYCKPEREIYRLAADILSVETEECVFIGDGGSRELYGAAEAGMRAYRAMWYIRQMPDAVKEMPFGMLETPEDVLGVLPGQSGMASGAF